MNSVALLITSFNRPQHLVRVLNAISNQKIPIIIGQDGKPKSGSDSIERHDQVRRHLQALKKKMGNLSDVLLLDDHLGCYKANRKIISWGFSLYDNLIILEDDIEASDSFVSFAVRHLNQFASSSSIGSLVGTNLVPESWSRNCGHAGSPRLSRFTSSWGWATWKDRWANFQDHNLEKSLKAHFCKVNSAPISVRNYWLRIARQLDQGALDSWAYRWLFSSWISELQTIVPPKSLVRNIGFDKFATNTRVDKRQVWSNLSLSTDNFHEPKDIKYTQCIHCDAWMEKKHHNANVMGQMRHLAARKKNLLKDIFNPN